MAWPANDQILTFTYFPDLASWDVDGSVMRSLGQACVAFKAPDILGENPNITLSRRGLCRALCDSGWVLGKTSPAVGPDPSQTAVLPVVSAHVTLQQSLTFVKKEEKCRDSGNPDRLDWCHPCRPAAACERVVQHMYPQCIRDVHFNFLLFCLHMCTLQMHLLNKTISLLINQMVNRKSTILINHLNLFMKQKCQIFSSLGFLNVRIICFIWV